MKATTILDMMIDKLPEIRKKTRFDFIISQKMHAMMCHELLRNVKTYKGYKIGIDNGVPKDTAKISQKQKRHGK